MISRRVEVDQAHQCHGSPRTGQGSGETSYRPVGLLAEELSVQAIANHSFETIAGDLYDWPEPHALRKIDLRVLVLARLENQLT